LLILNSSPNVNLSGSDWFAIAMIYVVSLIYVSVLYNFGLLVSCLTKKSATSLMFVLLFWIIMALLIPNISVSMAREFCVPEPTEKTDKQVTNLWAEFDKEYAKFKKTVPPRTGDTFFMDGIYGGSSFGCGMATMQYYQQIFAFRDPLRKKYAEEVWKIRREYFRDLTNQKDFADNISRFSPISLYEQIMSVLSRTDLDSFQDFIAQAITHRNEISEYIRSKTDNYSSISYFSPLSDEDIEEFVRLNQEFEKNVARLQKESGDDSIIGFLTEYMEPLEKFREKIVERSRYLDLSDLPEFVYKPINIVDSIRSCLLNIVILILTNVLLFSLSFVAFLRYDVR